MLGRIYSMYANYAGRTYTIYTISVSEKYYNEIFGNLSIKDEVNDYMKSSFKMKNNKYCVRDFDRKTPLYLIETKCKKLEKSTQDAGNGYRREIYEVSKNNIISTKTIKKFNNIEELAKYGNIQIADKEVNASERKNILKMALMKLRQSKIYNKSVGVHDDDKEYFLSGMGDSCTVCTLDWTDIMNDDKINEEDKILKDTIKDINKFFKGKAELIYDWDKLEGMIWLEVN